MYIYIYIHMLICYCWMVNSQRFLARPPRYLHLAHNQTFYHYPAARPFLKCCEMVYMHYCTPALVITTKCVLKQPGNAWPVSMGSGDGPSHWITTQGRSAQASHGKSWQIMIYLQDFADVQESAQRTGTSWNHLQIPRVEASLSI